MSPYALELKGVRKHFGGIRAVDGVSLRVRTGDRVAVIGPNGAGKSTLFGLVSGELRPDEGDVLLEGRSVCRASPQRRASLGLGRTYQSARLFAGLTVRENMELAQAAGGRRGSVRDALEEVGLSEGVERQAGALAQGERKRLELAMVLAAAPRVLLLDEPTAGMGREERTALMELIMGAVGRGRSVTVVFTEHDMDTVFAYARRIVVMDRGKPIADGPPEAVREDERVKRVYLGGVPPAKWCVKGGSNSG